MNGNLLDRLPCAYLTGAPLASEHLKGLTSSRELSQKRLSFSPGHFTVINFHCKISMFSIDILNQREISNVLTKRVGIVAL